MKVNGNESDPFSGRFGLRMPDRMGVDVSRIRCLCVQYPDGFDRMKPWFALPVNSLFDAGRRVSMRSTGSRQTRRAFDPGSVCLKYRICWRSAKAAHQHVPGRLGVGAELTARSW